MIQKFSRWLFMPLKRLRWKYAAEEVAVNGCTYAPDALVSLKNIIRKLIGLEPGKSWRELLTNFKPCCDQHDRDYDHIGRHVRGFFRRAWLRLLADLWLSGCMFRKGLSLAPQIYCFFVRLLGASHLPKYEGE